MVRELAAVLDAYLPTVNPGGPYADPRHIAAAEAAGEDPAPTSRRSRSRAKPSPKEDARVHDPAERRASADNMHAPAFTHASLSYMPPTCRVDAVPSRHWRHRRDGSVSDIDYDAKVRETFPQLDTWGRRFHFAFRPEPGSDLAQDDEDWPVLPLTQVAVASMGAARDHLQAVRVTVEVSPFFPFAQATLIRTATLAAAQAVWILAPAESEERIRNCRTLLQHIYDQHALFLRDLKASSPETHEGTNEALVHGELRLQEMKEHRATDGQKSAFNATAVIESAAQTTFGDARTALEAKAEWRRGSGAAHGLLWTIFGQPETKVTPDDDGSGMAAFEADGGMGALGNPYLCAYWLLNKAHALLTQRGAGPAD